MTDDFELSRREALAALGSVGVASAGAGLGTSAYFSDQETFQNNRLVAGELDLKMDWEEHYSDWSPDEDDSGSGEFEVLMDAPANADGYVPFPPGASTPLLWVPDESVDDFVDNIAVEAYPDSDDDGIADFPVEAMQGRSPCDFLADVGGNDVGLDPGSDPLGRTDNGDTRRDDGSPAPLIDLGDVKPGDFGQITFSTHLCDNPGYLWMNMPGGLDASENGVTEPERDDPDEDRPGGGVELVDGIRTALWYDDCDGLRTCSGEIDLMAVADTSESITGDLDSVADTSGGIDGLRDAGNALITALDARSPDADIHIGLLTFNGPGDADEAAPGAGVFDRPVLRAGLGPLSRFDTDGDLAFDLGDFLPNQGYGGTPLPYALDLAHGVLRDQGRPGAKSVILVVTDGLPDYVGSGPTVPYTVSENEGGSLPNTGNSYTSGTYRSPSGPDGVSDPVERSESERVATTIRNAGVDIRVVGSGLPASAENFFRFGIAGAGTASGATQSGFFYDPDDFPSLAAFARTVADDVVSGQQDGACEQIIFSGTLGELEAELTANGRRGVPLAGSLPAEDGGGSGRNCFASGTTHCFGLSWWLPVDHANEVQSDSVSFDLGFYTEQCRHNDGSGMNAESID